jgi:glutamyl/glutaminyl-tRNA synthetase
MPFGAVFACKISILADFFDGKEWKTRDGETNIDEGRIMKYRKQTVMMLCALMLAGCSKRSEECPVIASAVDGFQKKVLENGIESAAKSDPTAIQGALELSRAMLGTLNKKVLTEEEIVSFKGTAGGIFIETSKTLEAMSDLASSLSKLGPMASQATKQVEDAKAGLEAACDKKIRSRRARRKQQRECKQMRELLDGVKLDGLKAESLAAAIDSLQKASPSNTAVKQAIDGIVEAVVQAQKVAKMKAELEKKSSANQKKLDRLKQKSSGLQKKIKAYCADV